MRRRSRRKRDSSLEWLFLFGIILYSLSNKIFQSLHQMITNIQTRIKMLTVVEYFVIGFIVISLIYSIYFYLYNRNKHKKYQVQEETKLRVIRSSEYQKLISLSPFEFEKYVADLFSLMGYTTELTSFTGDGGKDIILRKGRDISLVECKRYNENHKVSRPEIQKFHSALVDMNAKEGFFITTGYFTQPAVEYSLDKSINLIDLPRLMKLIEKVKMNPQC